MKKGAARATERRGMSGNSGFSGKHGSDSALRPISIGFSGALEPATNSKLRKIPKTQVFRTGPAGRLYAIFLVFGYFLMCASEVTIAIRCR